MPKHVSTHSDRFEITTGVLTLSGGARRLRIAALDDATALYRAEFTDLIPTVSDHAGTITVGYPRRALRPRGTQALGTVRLAPSASWALRCTDALTALDADLTLLRITSIDIECPIQSSVFRLPTAEATTNVRVTGPARDLTILRPAGMPVDVRIAGSATGLHIDGRRLGSVSRGYQSDGQPGEGRYLITFDKAVAGLTIASDEDGGGDHGAAIT